jgi:hypothetical protein
VTPEDFAAWAARLGLEKLTPEDLDQLRQGWIGMQPQLARIREGLRETDKPPAPPLGLAR